MNKPVLALALGSTLIAAAMIWFGYDQLDDSSGASAPPVKSIDSRSGAAAPDRTSYEPPSPRVAAPKPSLQARGVADVEDDRLVSANDTATAEPPSIPSTAMIGKLLPERVDSVDQGAAKEDPAPLAKTTRVVCEFSDGSSNDAAAGGQLRSTGASWQGGPITYDSIDFDAGTAQMIGSVGATGSVHGHADARVILRGERLDFFVSLPTGGIVLTTVFGESRANDRYVAVMSRHEGLRSQGVGTYGAQFLGFCR
jgi:hypothetical protein